MKRDICQVTCIHAERLEKARQAMPAEREIVIQAELFKLLGDASRLRLLQALAVSEMCVCDLAALFESTVSAVSHQLRLLRTAGLVRYRKDGKLVFYRLGDQRLGSFLQEVQGYLGEESS